LGGFGMGYGRSKRAKDFPEFDLPLNSVYSIENQNRLITALPLSGRTKNALLLHSDIRTVEDLMELSAKDLMQLPGLGEKCLKDIDRCLQREQQNIQPPEKKKCRIIKNEYIWWIIIKDYKFMASTKRDTTFLRDLLVSFGFEVDWPDEHDI
jgi:predicted DNA-binding helix-hairpin-helix protein